MSTDIERWAERQARALIELGVDPQDAEDAIAWVRGHMPPGADPEHWTAPADIMAQLAGIMPEDIQDARVDWYASDAVPAQLKRILDARLMEDAD